MKDLLKDEKFLSVSATLFIHLSLLLLFLWIQVDFRPVIAEFLEVGFASPVATQEVGASQILPPSLSETKELEESRYIEPIQAQNIELPQRRQLDFKEEEIFEKLQSELEKKIEGPPVMKSPPRPSLPQRHVGSPIPAFTRREKTVQNNLFSRRVDERLLTGTPKLKIPFDKEFEIDWQGDVQREIYQVRLPEFPPEVQREAVIKIEFTVLPNGLVGSAVLLQKGDTRLENLTLEAFRTWRFNPIPSYMQQKIEKGVITFRFKLK